MNKVKENMDGGIASATQALPALFVFFPCIFSNTHIAQTIAEFQSSPYETKDFISTSRSLSCRFFACTVHLAARA